MIYLYTDGACRPNPGKGGAGIVLSYKKHILKIAIKLKKECTNNIAELFAILEGLKAIKDKDMPVTIFSDSKYCISVCTGVFKARKNKHLVDEIIKLINQHKSVRFVWIKAHSGHELNDTADELAGKAITMTDSRKEIREIRQRTRNNFH